ncbi:hypothetical protein K435DRAFT_839559 [Dendrothele bispora CBS 962.96]|uniref:Uncharacterized protein n=1 Tax=Dendrothele bispora (strain CBS 962.96) TaxID=1314807 RepID=A0A4S8M003_DENBC|nr:hypothetical protein K435DRAFT_839559 [Dendrothele bispora CBS 962.96]
MEVDAGDSVEAGQLGTDASMDKGSNTEDGNETISVDERVFKQVGSNRTEDSRRRETEGDLDMVEVVGTEQLQTPDKQGNRLSDAQVGGGTTGERNEDTGEARGRVDKSVSSPLMGDRTRVEGDRTKGKRDGKETGAVAEDETSKVERYGIDGAKAETRRESWSEAISGMPDTGEPGVDKDVNEGTDTEQRAAGGTGGKEDDIDMGGLVGARALQKEDSGDNGAQAAVTGMLPTTSSGGDEGPKGDKADGNLITNDHRSVSTGRTERERVWTLSTRDSPEDRSKDDATHAGSSRGGTASGTDIVDSSQGGGSQVTKASSTDNNEREERSIEDEE